MSTPREALDIALPLFVQHGLTDWSMTFDKARTRAGVCRSHTKEIGLSLHFVRLNSAERIRLTLIHEIAHALTPGHHHDKVWQAKDRELGGDGSRCYDDKTTAMPPPKYFGQCVTNSLHTWAQHRLSRNDRAGLTSCGHCYNPNDPSAGRITWSIRTLTRG